MMNRWQRAFMDQMGFKNVPRGKWNKWCFDVLGKVRETVTVQFPEFRDPHGVKPAETKTFVVDENKIDMPNGFIDVLTLASNLEFWIADRGYKVTTSGKAQM